MYVANIHDGAKENVYMNACFEKYVSTLHGLLNGTKASDLNGNEMHLEEAMQKAINAAKITEKNGNKIIFVGNGGSAAIASHMAIDFSNAAKIPSVNFNDGAAITCLGNDYGYKNVFSRQVELHAKNGDLLVAISSSGKSENILNAVDAARKKDCNVLTLSGFNFGNPLSKSGDVNFYVKSSEYGFVEVSHLCLCHAILDMVTGWGKN